MQSIELKVGPSSIKIDPTGITVKGMMITIEGQNVSVQPVFTGYWGAHYAGAGRVRR